MKRKQLCALVIAALMSVLAMDLSALPPAQTTAFTYQGQLNAGGSLASGLYQFTFTLYDAATGGAPVVGTLPIQQPIQVINGLFTTDLDFGQVFAGTQYWLEIKVGITIANEEALSARQPINTVPVAQYALNSPAGKAGLVFASNIINPTTLTSFFFPPNGSGDTTGGGNWGDYDKAAIPMPIGCTFDRLYLNLSSVPFGLGGGGPTTVTLWVNGIGTPLSASGDTTLGAATSNTTGSVTVNAGDTIALEATGAGLGAGQGTINASLHCK
jgi:hypothetical protein